MMPRPVPELPPLPLGATMADLLGAGDLVGRRVRIKEDVLTMLAAGDEGHVLDVSSDGKVLVEYVRTDRHEGHPWRIVHLESPHRRLELVR